MTISVLLSLSFALSTISPEDPLEPLDVFELEYAADPQISPDGSQVVYVRRFMDIMTDTTRSHLWISETDGSRHRPLITGDGNYNNPIWSPNGDRIAFTHSEESGTDIAIVWMDSGQSARISRLTESPSGLLWTPDGKALAFSMLVPSSPDSMITMPEKPSGAQWAEPARVIRNLNYRGDGRGFIPLGYRHLFLLSAEGGTPRQLTHGEFHHPSPGCFTPDGTSLIFSANRSESWELDGRESELYELSLASSKITKLTNRSGPDSSPAVSPDGKSIAYLGFDDEKQGYQVTRLYLMNRDGSQPRSLCDALDRDIESPQFIGNNRIAFQFDDRGRTKIASITLGDGALSTHVSDVGGTTLGRPYSSGSFSANHQGTIAYTRGDFASPADVWVVPPGKAAKALTSLNADILPLRTLATLEEINYPSRFDDRNIQGWIAYPPHFDPKNSYPLILEIHGGPFANYGDRFAMEIQLFCAAGYVVLFTNPRGSTSYGEEFGNLIHHAYPSQDFDDLMSGVDAVIQKFAGEDGGIDTKRLYVTGGSGGGVLTSWIVGHTNRFRAAVVAKPVINWYSFALTADMVNTAIEYWFPGPPWEYAEHYMARSPISYVGHVTTPTMLLTGEEDYRTPIGETEQYYNALKTRGVDTAMVRIPGASHGIASRPSRLISKVLHILSWFDTRS